MRGKARSCVRRLRLWRRREIRRRQGLIWVSTGLWRGVHAVCYVWVAQGRDVSPCSSVMKVVGRMGWPGHGVGRVRLLAKAVPQVQTESSIAVFTGTVPLLEALVLQAFPPSLNILRGKPKIRSPGSDGDDAIGFPGAVFPLGDIVLQLDSVRGTQGS